MYIEVQKKMKLDTIYVKMELSQLQPSEKQ